MTKPDKLSGNVWLLEKENELIDNIDTDMIFHNNYLAITDQKEMGQYTLKFLKGYEELYKKIVPGDIIVAGKNFGSGSSRQQAVDCFIALGVSAILAKSFGAIYKRNAINSGLPILEAEVFLNSKKIKTGDTIEVNLLTGEILPTNEVTFLKALPMSKVQLEIYRAGDIFRFLEK